jgi:hypothetical protein
VEGQVLSADTGLPLPGVKVTQGKNSRDSLSGSPKGAELLVRKTPVLTDAEGRFVLGSERVLSLVRGSGWDQVRLTFEHAGYQRFRTNYSMGWTTNSPGSEPMLNVGQVRLLPESRGGEE